MPKFIEVTRATNDKGPGEGRSGTKALVDVCGAVIETQQWSGYSRMNTVIHTTGEASVRAEESYASIKGTLRRAGIEILSVTPSDKVLFPASWLKLIYPALEEFCRGVQLAAGVKGKPCYEDCPLCDGDECIKEIVWKGDLPHA